MVLAFHPAELVPADPEDGVDEAGFALLKTYSKVLWLVLRRLVGGAGSCFGGGEWGSLVCMTWGEPTVDTSSSESLLWGLKAKATGVREKSWDNCMGPCFTPLLPNDPKGMESESVSDLVVGFVGVMNASSLKFSITIPFTIIGWLFPESGGERLGMAWEVLGAPSDSQVPGFEHGETYMLVTLSLPMNWGL